jgi:hypothetical protein
VAKLEFDPRLPVADDVRSLKSRLYEVLRAIATAVNRLDDGYSAATVSVSSNYTVQRGDAVVLVDASGGARVITLQQPAEAKDKRLSVRKVDASANTVTVVPPAGQIDGAASLVLTAAAPRATLASSGSNHFTV